MNNQVKCHVMYDNIIINSVKRPQQLVEGLKTQSLALELYLDLLILPRDLTLDLHHYDRDSRPMSDLQNNDFISPPYSCTFKLSLVCMHNVKGILCRICYL